MTKAEIKRQEKRKRLLRRALEAMATEPIHETEETPLSVTQELIAAGLAKYDYSHAWADRHWHYRDVVLTDAGRAELSAVQLVK